MCFNRFSNELKKNAEAVGKIKMMFTFAAAFEREQRSTGK